MTAKTYIVEGLTCTDCAERVQTAVAQVAGVEDSQVNLAAGTLTVSLARPDLNDREIIQAVQAAGYTLRASRRPAGRPFLGFVRFILSRRETTLTAVAALLTLLGLPLALFGAPPWSKISLYAVAIVVGGAGVAWHAWQEVWVGRSLGINALMVIAVCGRVGRGGHRGGAILVGGGAGGVRPPSKRAARWKGCSIWLHLWRSSSCQTARCKKWPWNN